MSDAEAFRQAVLEGDLRTSRLLAQRLREAALEPLEALVRHHDWKVRQAAMTCLGETMGNRAGDLLVLAMKDESVMVRASATDALCDGADSFGAARLLAAFRQADEPPLRERLARALGRPGDPAVVPALSHALSTEKDPHARGGIIAALARFDVPAAREELSARLAASSGSHRARCLELCHYVGAPWIAELMIPIIDDPQPLMHLGGPEGGRALRACDIAVHIAAQVTALTLSFSPKELREFTDAELAEAQGRLRQLFESRRYSGA